MASQKSGLRKRMQDGELVVCMVCTHLRSPDLPMIADACGLDAIYLDLEHGNYSVETATDICIAAIPVGMPTLVRVPSHLAHHASRVLDNGATGVIVPNVRTADEARRAVQACRYTPLGVRGVMGLNAMTRYRSTPTTEWTAKVNEETVVIIMLETAEGVANAREIAAVEGVDCLLIGSNDLCADMGIMGQMKSPKLLEAYEQVATACKESGKTHGVGGIRGDPEMVKRLYTMGARYFNTGGDLAYIISAAHADLKQIRGACA